MAYAKRYAGGFVDLPTQTTAIDSTFLNAVEAALLKLFDTDPTVDGQVQSWISASTKFGPALILNKNVDAAAGIVKSKLDFTGANGIVNADIAGAAAIAYSKLSLASSVRSSDLALSTDAANLSGDQNLGVNTATTIMSTGTLAVGTWLITMVASCVASGAGLFDLTVQQNTATATFVGCQSSGADISGASIEVCVSLAVIATVTVSGTLKFVGEGSNATQTTVKATSRNYASPKSTGYTAVRIA